MNHFRTIRLSYFNSPAETGAHVPRRYPSSGRSKQKASGRRNRRLFSVLSLFI